MEAVERGRAEVEAEVEEAGEETMSVSVVVCVLVRWVMSLVV